MITFIREVNILTSFSRQNLNSFKPYFFIFYLIINIGAKLFHNIFVVSFMRTFNLAITPLGDTRTYEKLQCKGEPYQFRQTDRHPFTSV